MLLHSSLRPQRGFASGARHCAHSRLGAGSLYFRLPCAALGRRVRPSAIALARGWSRRAAECVQEEMKKRDVRMRYASRVVYGNRYAPCTAHTTFGGLFTFADVLGEEKTNSGMIPVNVRHWQRQPGGALTTMSICRAAGPTTTWDVSGHTTVDTGRHTREGVCDVTGRAGVLRARRMPVNGSTGRRGRRVRVAQRAACCC